MTFFLCVGNNFFTQVLESTVFQIEIPPHIFKLEQGTRDEMNLGLEIVLSNTYGKKIITTTFYSLFNVCKVMKKHAFFFIY